MSNKTKISADIAVIGAGSGGLSVAAGAAMLGLKVVMFEKGKMGGDCLNYGCVPSKALITVARHAQMQRELDRFGLSSSEPNVDWNAVRAHVDGAIAAIEPNDSVERFEGLGVQVIQEAAKFKNKSIVESANYEVKARRIVVATGSRAVAPPISGLNEVPFLTNEEIFSLPVFPSRLIVLGGGPIGVELGQAFQRLGSKVTIVERAVILERADEEHAEIVRTKLRDEGVVLQEDANVLSASTTPDGGVKLEITNHAGARVDLEGSHLLVAAGRAPVLEGLGLDAGGVTHDKRGIKVRENLRSISNSRVWAVGDAAGRGQFTHLAGWHASVFVRNALFKSRSRANDLPLPAVTYCEPEMAQIGLSEAQARMKFGDKVSVSSFEFEENDRAIAEGDTVGGAKLVIHKGKVIGASVLGAGAGDIVQVAGIAMSNGLKASAFTNFISPYPTRAEVIKRAASAHFQPLVFGTAAKRLVGVLQLIP